MVGNLYRASDYGKSEEAMMVKYFIQKEDAKNYFNSVIKPQLDRAYKLYVAYNGDRAKEIQSWQANVCISYPQAVVETLMPRVLDARPDFTTQGRNEDDQPKAVKIQQLSDFTWEIAKMDDTGEMFVRSSMMYGTGYLQVSYKRDERSYNFLTTKNLSEKKYEWKNKKQIFYDAPYAEWVDNYELWYDWHNIPRQSKQYWLRRKILTGGEIKRRYPSHDKKRLDIAINSYNGDLTDHASIRKEVKMVHSKTTKGADRYGSGSDSQLYQSTVDPDLRMHEVFEWWRPFDDAYAVMVNDIPVLKNGYIPNPYDFKEAPFIELPYLKLPNEFEGVGIPIILENPTVMLNLIKNQRLDAAILNIHKMWIVNPLANIETRDLVVRPFGIIYSADTAGVREVQFSDIKQSSYREEELLKGDMRYASGVDDFSMGVGGSASSATEVRHLRESTLERVRLFINHLGSAYSDLQRYWISMYRQFFTEDMVIRVTGDNGLPLFPLIEKDDLKGEFDFKASVIPSIAGKNDIDKKQGMDLYQLLIDMPFIDPRKLTSKILHSWNWDLNSIAKEEEPAPQEMPVMPGMEGMLPPPTGEEMISPESGMPPMPALKTISPDVMQRALELMGGAPKPKNSPFQEASAPINLLRQPNMPPTVLGIKGKNNNTRGLNRKVGGAVNTNIPTKPQGIEEHLLNRASNIQR
jgi:hypothetical protein